MEKLKCPHCQQRLGKKCLKYLFSGRQFHCEFCSVKLCYGYINNQKYSFGFLIITLLALSTYSFVNHVYIAGVLFGILLINVILYSVYIHSALSAETFLDRNINWIALIFMIGLIYSKFIQPGRYPSSLTFPDPNSKYYPGATDLVNPRYED